MGSLILPIKGAFASERADRDLGWCGVATAITTAQLVKRYPLENGRSFESDQHSTDRWPSNVDGDPNHTATHETRELGRE